MENAVGIPVLIYHQVIAATDKPGETIISLDLFREQMRYLYDNGYSTLSIGELVGFMQGASAPEKAIVLTFDDGWKSVMEIIPVLTRYRFKASFFIFPGKGIGGPYMDWKALREIAANPDFEIASHSLTHPWDKRNNLVTWIEGRTANKGAADIRYELTESKKILEKRLRKRIRYFAWPCGWYNEELIELARDAGYEAVLTAEEGVNLPQGDIMRIKRIFVDGACCMDVFAESIRDFTYHVCQGSSVPTKGHLPPD